MMERRESSRWAWIDGLWCAIYGVFVLGLLVGIACGRLIYG